MKKTFREQMAIVIAERYRNDTQMAKRYLKEATTHAAETLITYIRQWPEQHKSRNQALGRLLERQRWNDQGELVLDTNHRGRAYPAKLPLAMAYEWYQFGDQNKQFYPMYSFADGVNSIPANAKKDWMEEIQGLFMDINRMSLGAFKAICLGKWVKSYGTSNPHTFSNWEREVSEFTKAQEAINRFVATRNGWEYISTENMQNPTHKAEMSKVIMDILAKADEAVEPAVKAIREQDRQMYIRQDATRARNNVKYLRDFFKKYAQPNPNALELVAGIINDVEAQTLENKELTKRVQPLVWQLVDVTAGFPRSAVPAQEPVERPNRGFVAVNHQLLLIRR